MNCGQKTRAKGHPPGSAASGSSERRSPQETQSTAARTTYNDAGNVSEMSLPYLRPSPAQDLFVEIAYVKDRQPAQDALDHLATVLRRETKKKVTVALGAQLPQSESTYSLDDIVALSERHRAHRSEGVTATAWIAFLNGSLKDGEGVLAITSRASEIAVFPDQINQAATAIVDSIAIERSVLVHEFGHLLGLVNIGYKSRFDHEDHQHPGHSKYQTSVMYWAIEDISIAALLSGGPPDDYDQYDRADLAMLRAS